MREAGEHKPTIRRPNRKLCFTITFGTALWHVSRHNKFGPVWWIILIFSCSVNQEKEPSESTESSVVSLDTTAIMYICVTSESITQHAALHPSALGALCTQGWKVSRFLKRIRVKIMIDTRFSILGLFCHLDAHLLCHRLFRRRFLVM